MGILLLISTLNNIEEELCKITINSKSSIQIKEKIDEYLVLILTLSLLYLLELENKKKQKELKPIITFIILSILKVNRYVKIMPYNNKKSSKTIKISIDELLSLILFLLLGHAVECQNNKISLNTLIALLALYIAKFATQVETVHPNIESENSFIKSTLINNKEMIPLIKCTPASEENIIKLVTPVSIKKQISLPIATSEYKYYETEELSPSYSNKITNMIKKSYMGVNISTLIYNTFILTGEVVFNIDNIIALKSKSRITFINEKAILGFF